MNFLTAEDLLGIHSVIIDETGGTHGVRDRNALLSLEGLPRQSAFGKELYPSIYLKAAIYVRSIMFGHPFIDGNKRTAVSSANVFLELNGYVFNPPKGEVERYAVYIVVHKQSLEHIADWIEKYTIQQG